jgi:hypothetical protein
MGESAQDLEAYLSKMVDLLRMDGVRFPDNKEKKFHAPGRDLRYWQFGRQFTRRGDG